MDVEVATGGGVIPGEIDVREWMEAVDVWREGGWRVAGGAAVEVDAEVLADMGEFVCVHGLFVSTLTEWGQH